MQVIYEHRELADKSAVRQGRGGRIGSLTLEGKKLFRNGVGAFREWFVTWESWHPCLNSHWKQ